MRLNLAQRVVLVVALGVVLFVLGQWIVVSSRPYPTGWTGYAPLQDQVYGPGGLTPTEVLLMWIGFAFVWSLASLGILRSARSSNQSSATSDSSQD